MKRSRKRQEKWELRQAAKFLMGLTNDRDWGLKLWDDLEQKSVPKHVNCKQTLLHFLTGFRVYPKQLTQKVLIEHFLGKKTVYFTGSRCDKTILMLDIDCHKSGSLEAQGSLLFGDNYSSTSATIRIPFEEPAACAPSLRCRAQRNKQKRGHTPRAAGQGRGPDVMPPRVVWPAWRPPVGSLQCSVPESRCDAPVGRSLPRSSWGL